MCHQVHLFHFKVVKERNCILECIYFTLVVVEISQAKHTFFIYFYSLFYLRYYSGFWYVLFHNFYFNGNRRGSLSLLSKALQ